MPKQKIEIETINKVVEVEGIPQFDQHIKKGYKLLAVRVHADVNGNGNISSCALFIMGKHDPSILS
jgi:hypothetical protein